MRRKVKKSSLRIAVLLAVPAIAFPAAVSLTSGNTVTCEFGTCSSIDSLTAGQTAGSFLDIPFTVNGNSFELDSLWSAWNNDPHSTKFTVTPIVTYTGSSPLAQSDIFTIDFWQNFTYSGITNGTYHESTGSYVNAAPGSTLSMEAFFGGQGVGLMGPFGLGDAAGDGVKQLTGVSGDPLTFEYSFIFDFAKGSDPGSVIAAPAAIPEPGSGVFALFGVMLLGAGGWKRVRQAFAH